jgi:hypothetical protein
MASQRVGRDDGDRVDAIWAFRFSLCHGAVVAGGAGEGGLVGGRLVTC